MPKLYNLVLFAVFVLMFDASFAADSSLNFTGTVIASSCDIDSNSQTQSVHIGDFTSSSFSTTGAVSAFKAFNINLLNCPAGITGSKVMFSGDADADNPTLLALSDMSGVGGMASGVAIELIDNSMNTIPINSDSVLNPLSPGVNTLSFLLRYKSTKNQVTAGNASSVMYFDLEYQ